MSKVATIHALRITVVALYALAMAVVGMARHDAGVQAPAADVAAFADAYALPGDDTAVLCQHGSAGDQGRPDNGSPTGSSCCDACVMAHAPGVGGIASLDPAHPPAGRIAHSMRQLPDLIADRQAEPVSRGPPVA